MFSRVVCFARFADHARAAAEAATLLAEVSALEAVAVAGDKARAEAAAAKIGIEALSAAARQVQPRLPRAF
eukprot:958370-Pleurochrysis_carterae.AAC.2